jgi:multidrug resistance efflux pump
MRGSAVQICPLLPNKIIYNFGMNENTPTNEFTQKDLMQHLLNVSQHVATREELSEVKAELKQDIAEVKAELKQDIAEIKADISELRADISGIKIEMGRLTVKLGGMIVAGIGVLAILIKL